MSRKIDSKLSDLPKNPGVYFHKNKDGKIIYVGKAAVLRNRVRQYFQKSRTRDPKTEALVTEIADIEWIEVETEADALFLEAELIKRYKPQYNIALRDDKSNSYVRIDIKNSHPTVTYSRRPLDDGAEYFGPFDNGPQLRRAMKLLRKVFPYDTKKPQKGERASLDFHIGLSPGIQEGGMSLDEYRTNLRLLMRYLRGSRVELINELEQEMKHEAAEKNFEKAASIRNQVMALKHLRKQVVFSKDEFMDISKDQALAGLQDLLKLKSMPRRIEGYDISHQSGTNNVASMVVFTNGLPDKTEYKKFKMKLPGNNDFGHMNEVISRRFSLRNTSSWPKPDLLLIDGGKGQLSSALDALESKGVESIPAIGLAKRYETIIVKTEDGFDEIRLPESSHIIKLLQRIRDESHRFAVSYHSTLKRTGQTENILESIPGIGPSTKKKLLRKFGSYKKVSEATEIELAEIIGDSKAKLVKDHYSN